jgi:hypothetical protein
MSSFLKNCSPLGYHETFQHIRSVDTLSTRRKWWHGILKSSVVLTIFGKKNLPTSARLPFREMQNGGGHPFISAHLILVPLLVFVLVFEPILT